MPMQFSRKGAKPQSHSDSPNMRLKLSLAWRAVRMGFILHPSSFVLPLCLLGGCAGYQIGNQSLYPTEIHTVYVPMFESASFRRGLGEELTEAVVKQIELKTPYKVVSDPNADSVLSGRIVSERKGVLVRILTGDPREVQVGMRVQVSWADRRGNLLRRSDPINLPPAVTNISSTSDIVPEVGQSIATGQMQAISRLAEQIVSVMEAPW
jgi:hypothetical protein